VLVRIIPTSLLNEKRGRLAPGFDAGIRVQVVVRHLLPPLVEVVNRVRCSELGGVAGMTVVVIEHRLALERVEVLDEPDVVWPRDAETA